MLKILQASLELRSQPLRLPGFPGLLAARMSPHTGAGSGRSPGGGQEDRITHGAEKQYDSLPITLRCLFLSILPASITPKNHTLLLPALAPELSEVLSRRPKDSGSGSGVLLCIFLGRRFCWFPSSIQEAGWGGERGTQKNF